MAHEQFLLYLVLRPAGFIPVGESNPSPGFVDFSLFICCKMEFNSLITLALGLGMTRLLTSGASPHNLEVLSCPVLAILGCIPSGGGGGAGGGITKVSMFSSRTASL